MKNEMTTKKTSKPKDGYWWVFGTRHAAIVWAESKEEAIKKSR